MARFAVIPAAPILLEGVDLQETAEVAGLRGKIRSLLGTADEWALPVSELPPMAGIGGYGIDRGIDLRTNALLEGEDWRLAVLSLSSADREECVNAHPAIGIAALHAHAAGSRLKPAEPIEATSHLLIPIDLSAAATPDAPLAPVPGALDFDAQVLACLRSGNIDQLSACLTRAEDFRADLSLLGAALEFMSNDPSTAWPVTGGGANGPVATWVEEFDTSIHEVRSICGYGEY